MESAVPQRNSPSCQSGDPRENGNPAMLWVRVTQTMEYIEPVLGEACQQGVRVMVISCGDFEMPCG